MDEQNLKEEVGKNTRTQTQTRKLNEKGTQTFVFIDLGEGYKPSEQYWLDFEDSEEKLPDEKDLFKIPIVYPIVDDPNFDIINNNLTNITTFENNKFNFEQLNNCLYSSSNNKLNNIQVFSQMYINLPTLFTIRIEIKRGSQRLFLGYVTLEKNIWYIDIINDGRLNNLLQGREEIFRKIVSDDAYKDNLTSFKRNERLQYTFDNTYKNLLKQMTEADIKAGINYNLDYSPSKMPGFGKSPYSPAGVVLDPGSKAENFLLPVELYLGDIERHSVEGLKDLASDRTRFNSKIITHSGFPKIPNLDNDEGSQKLLTISKQLDPRERKQFISNEISCRRMVNDTVDRAHDFIYINRETITFNADQTGCGEEYTKKLTNDLLSTESSNINVPNSHSIQEDNITELHRELKNKGIIVPSLPKDIFVSRRFVFADFFDFLFKVDQLPDNEKIEHLSKRSHYAESGKQVTLKTLNAYLDDLGNNPEEQDLFLIDIQRLTKGNNNNGLETLTDIRTLILRIQRVIGDRSEEYPIIFKNCYQQMDGCSTGPSDFGSSLPKARIDGIFGLYDIHLENNLCNQNQQVNTITVSKGEDIVYIINVVGEITLDKVVRSILAIDNNVKYKFRGNNSVKGDIFEPLPIKGTKNEKILILMALKTFCDKLYRLSMENEKKLTHIFTIDSYVYGDPYLQYLLAEEPYCPAVLRSAQGIVHDVEKKEDDRVTINKLCKQDVGKIKGFWYRPSIGIENSEKGYLEKLYERFACYFWILINTVDNLEENYPDIYGYIIDIYGCTTSRERPTSFIKSNEAFKIHSHRVNNYFDRIAYFWTNYKSLSDFNPNNKLDYNEVMGHLTYLEICKVFNAVKDYISDSQKIYLKINPIGGTSEIDDKLKEEIREFLIQVPDLENLLQLSSPTIFVENQEIGVNIEERQNDDLRILYANDKKECQDIFGIHVEEDEENENSGSPVFDFINYDEETDEIGYNIIKNNNTVQTKSNSFTLEFAIYLYNDMLDRAADDKADKLIELKKIIIQKIDTLKDLIGIKDEECKNIQDFIIFSKPDGSEEFDPTVLINAAAIGAFNSPNQRTTYNPVYNPQIEYATDDDDDIHSGEQREGQALFRGNPKAESKPEPSQSEKRNLSPSSKEGITSKGKTQRIDAQKNTGNTQVQFPDIGTTGSPVRATRPYSGTNVPPPVDQERRQQQKTKGKPNDPSGGKRHENKQTRRVKKRLRKTLNKINKMTYKNKTKRRRKNRRKTRKL